MKVNAKFQDAVNLYNGREAVKSPKGCVPIYAIGGQDGYTEHSICDVPCVAIGAAGTIGKPRLLYPPYWITGTQVYVTAKLGWEIDYIYACLSELNWPYFTNSYAIPPKLCVDELMDFEIISANLDQQRFIARVWNLWEGQISGIKKMPAMLDQQTQDLFNLMFGDPCFAAQEEKFANELYKLA